MEKKKKLYAFIRKMNTNKKNNKYTHTYVRNNYKIYRNN